MIRGQTIARRWLVADERSGDLLQLARSLPRGSGILLLHPALPGRERRKLLSQLKRIARSRNLTIVDEHAGEAIRLHNMRELRRAGLARTPILFVSPMFPTRSHPDWKPLPRMRAAAFLRLAQAPAIALGGMTETRFRTVKQLGFAGWAGIDGWRLKPLMPRG